MVKDIVVVADLGAAGNLVRNLLLLSSQTDWPLLSNRFDTILNQYRPTVKLENWLPVEYQLRFWDKYYGLDLSDNIDIEQFNARKTKNTPVVYLNHSAFYQLAEYQQLVPDVNTLYISPVTDFGLSWQVRSYCEKKTVKKLHNFTFDNNAEQHIFDFCNTFGEESYYRLNVTNFKNILKERQREFGVPDITLEQLLFDPAEQIVSILLSKLNININVKQADRIIAAWRSLHWPIEDTTNWKYYD